MKTYQSKDDCLLRQTVADGFELNNGGKAIAVEFTDQKLSAHAGSAPFWAWLHGTGWSSMLAKHFPHRAPTSNNHLTAAEKASAFTRGLLCEARKPTRLAYFRRGPVVPELLGYTRSGLKPCLHPLLAVLPEPRMVARLWLRAGSSRSKIR